MEHHPAVSVFFEELRNMCECGHWENVNLLLKLLCMILWFDRGVRGEKSLRESKSGNCRLLASWGFTGSDSLVLESTAFFCLKVPEATIHHGCPGPPLLKEYKRRDPSCWNGFLHVMCVAVVHSWVIDLLFPHQGNSSVWGSLSHTGPQVGDQVGH